MPEPSSILIDDRGTPIAGGMLASARRDASTPDRREPLFRSVDAILSTGVYGNPRSPSLSAARPFQFVVLFIFAVASPITLAIGSLPAIITVGALLVVPALFILFFFSVRPTDSVVHTRTYVYAGLCGQCGFSLKGLVTQPDGCVVCPECAAAWHEESIAPIEFIDRIGAIPPRSFLRVARSSIIDARGRAVPLAMPDLRELPVKERAAMHPSHLRFIRHASGGLFNRIFPLLLAGIMLFAAALQIVGRTAGAKSSVLSTFGTTSLIICSLMLLAHFLPRAIDQLQITDVRRYAAALLTANRCPSCARTLTQAPDPSLGTRRCTHCRSEWSINLVTLDAQTAQDRTNDRLRSTHTDSSSPNTQSELAPSFTRSSAADRSTASVRTLPPAASDPPAW